MTKNWKYYLVGANWPGQNMCDIFVEGGCWQLSPHGQIDPLYIQRFNSMEPGDRIAIKSLMGTKMKTMAIIAIGVITDIHRDYFFVEVAWVATGLYREVPLYGCMRALSDPKTIPQDEKFINRAFRI